MTLPIAALPQQERPRERLLKKGAKELSNAELLAILIGSGTQGASAVSVAAELLARFDGLQGVMEASIREMSGVRGMGKVKALQLTAAFEIVKRVLYEVTEPNPIVKTPHEAYTMMRGHLEGRKQEAIVALLRDRRCRMIRTEVVAIGGLSSAGLSPRDLFYAAIREGAASLILAHNHPSGDPTPSRADLAFTRRLIAAGELLKLPLDDHLVFGCGSFISLRSEHPSLWSFGEQFGNKFEKSRRSSSRADRESPRSPHLASQSKASRPTP